MTVVRFYEYTDGISALYLNNKLIHTGDKGYDKIDQYIEGYLDGLRKCDREFEVEYLICGDNNGIKVSHGYRKPPKSLKTVKKWRLEWSPEHIPENRNL